MELREICIKLPTLILIERQFCVKYPFNFILILCQVFLYFKWVSILQSIIQYFILCRVFTCKFLNLNVKNIKRHN